MHHRKVKCYRSRMVIFFFCLSEAFLGHLHGPHLHGPDPDLYSLLFYLVFSNLQPQGTHIYMLIHTLTLSILYTHPLFTMYSFLPGVNSSLIMQGGEFNPIVFLVSHIPVFIRTL